MPLIKYHSRNFPFWSEVRNYEIIRLEPGENTWLDSVSPREKIFVCRGSCEVISESGRQTLNKGDSCDEKAMKYIMNKAAGITIIFRVCGKWTDNVGGSGVFELDKSEIPKNIGDPVKYPRNTDFDNHYHDCDEFWFIIEGKGIAVTEGNFYEVEPGDCVVTKKGHHHDFPTVIEPILGIYFETSLSGQMRTGHLWDHTHWYN